MYEISKEFEFEASHVLTKVPAGHKCGRLPSHGHSYKVMVFIRSYFLDEMGFVMDFGELDFLKKYIDENLDHRFLNDVFDFETTAENIAKHIFTMVENYLHEKNMSLNIQPWVERVDVWETHKSKGSWINE